MALDAGYNGYLSGYGGADASGGAWYSDPKLWAAIANAAAAYGTASTAKKGNLSFKAQPETPEEKAYRIYAENLAGMHGVASPTYQYLAPQIDAALRNVTASQAAYQGLDKIDPTTGKMIPRVAVPQTSVDFSKLPRPWANPVASIGSGSTTTSAAANAPPPPPAIPETTHQKRKLATGILKGLVGGAVGGGGVGGVVGAVTGGLGARKEVKNQWDANHADYNQWLAMYGNSFTDAAGRPVPAPKNTAEYNAWYVAKYGTPPPTGTP